MIAEHLTRRPSRVFPFVTIDQTSAAFSTPRRGALSFYGFVIGISAVAIAAVSLLGW